MRLVIVSPNRDAYSETFIRAHVEHLEKQPLVLTDGFLPKRYGDGRTLLSQRLGARMLRRANERLTRRAPSRSLEARIAALLRADRAEVVLAEYGPTGMAMLGPCRRAGVPLVVHFHGIDAFHTALLREHGQYLQLFEGAAAIVVVSREMERQMIGLGAPDRKVHYNCYGVDVERFTTGDPRNAAPRLIAVGRFVDKKAPHLTLSAFVRALEREPVLRLEMIGDGPLLEACRQMVAAWRIGHAVEFTGVRDPATVAASMRAARAFVQHSVVTEHQDREGTPLSVLEAMASGLPVIATRHGGIPDVVHHEEEGLLSEERDVEAMAEHMIRMSRDARQAAEMGARGRERIKAHFTIGQSIAGLRDILDRAIAR